MKHLTGTGQPVPRWMALKSRAYCDGLMDEMGPTGHDGNRPPVFMCWPAMRSLPLGGAYYRAETAQQARDCLQFYGRRHRVCGVALHLGNGQLRHRLIQSHVSFRLSSLDIDQYIDNGDWRGKAGGYAIQGMAARFRDIGGSYSNIVGLAFMIAAMLDRRAGIRRA